MKNLSILLIGLLMYISATANTYGSIDNEQGQNFIETSDHGYLLLGYKGVFQSPGDNDIYLVRLNSDLDTLWTRTIGDAGWFEYAADAVELPNGGFFVLGTKTNGNDGAAWILKLNSVGDTLWTTYWWDVETAWGGYEGNIIQMVNSNNFFIVADHFVPSSGYDLDTLAIDSTGGLTTTITPIAGSMYNLISTDYTTYIERLDSTGNVLWTAFLNLNNTNPMTTHILSNGGIGIIGDSVDTNLNTSDVWFIVFDSLGNQTLTYINTMPSNEKQLNIYAFPNPSITNITVRVTSDKVFVLEIFNPIGQRIYSDTFTREINIDRNKFPSPGEYIARISDTTMSQTKTLMIY